MDTISVTDFYPTHGALCPSCEHVIVSDDMPEIGEDVYCDNCDTEFTVTE